MDDSVGPPSFVGKPYIRVIILGGNGEHPLAFVKRGYGGSASYSQWDCSDGKG